MHFPTICLLLIIVFSKICLLWTKIFTFNLRRSCQNHKLLLVNTGCIWGFGDKWYWDLHPKLLLNIPVIPKVWILALMLSCIALLYNIWISMWLLGFKKGTQFVTLAR